MKTIASIIATNLIITEARTTIFKLATTIAVLLAVVDTNTAKGLPIAIFEDVNNH